MGSGGLHRGDAAGRGRRLLASVPDLRAVGRRYDLRALAGGVELETRAIDGPPADFAFVVPEGRGVQRAGEVTFGRGALEAMGAQIGDTVELSVDGRRFDARVVGRHVEPSNDGRGAVTLAAPSRPRRCGGRPGSCGSTRAPTPRASRRRSTGWGRGGS